MLSRSLPHFSLILPQMIVVSGFSDVEFEFGERTDSTEQRWGYIEADPLTGLRLV